MEKKYLMYAYPERPDFHIYYIIDTLTGLEEKTIHDLKEWCSSKKIVSGVGTIIEIETEARENGQTGITYKKDAPIVGRWHNQDEVAAWIVKRRAVEALKTIEKDAKVDLFRLQMEPLRQMYRNADRRQKHAILAEIIRVITT